MTKKKLYIAWGVMYVLCTALGFVPSPEGALYGLLFMLSLAFFIPPAVLLYRAVQRSDLATVRLVRVLSLASLIATLVALVLNFEVAETELFGEAFCFYYFPHIFEFGVPVLLFKLGLIKKDPRCIVSTLSITMVLINLPVIA